MLLQDHNYAVSQSPAKLKRCLWSAEDRVRQAKRTLYNANRRAKRAKLTVESLVADLKKQQLLTTESEERLKRYESMLICNTKTKPTA